MNVQFQQLILSPGQRKTAEKLRGTIQLATGNFRQFLPLVARTNTLVAGQSGCGKSHLVRALALEAKLPLWETNVSNWIVLGARTGEPTLESLTAWIAVNRAGIIFLDELEKISDPNPWHNSIRLELHSICDGIIPESVLPAADDLDAPEFADGLNPVQRKAVIRGELEQKLRTTFAIIGAGAWQQEWSRASETIGFQNSRATARGLDRRQLLTMISPEILQRFRHDVLFLEPMKREDYLEVLTSLSGLLPIWQRDRFNELAIRSFPRALEDGLGMRIFEEIYTDLCIEMGPAIATHLPGRSQTP